AFVVEGEEPLHWRRPLVRCHLAELPQGLTAARAGELWQVHEGSLHARRSRARLMPPHRRDAPVAVGPSAGLRRVTPGRPRRRPHPAPAGGYPEPVRADPLLPRPPPSSLAVAGKDVVDVGAAVAVMGDSSAAQTALEVGGPQARPLISC